MSGSWKVLIVVALVFASLGQAAATTYYVNSSFGSDSNAGTSLNIPFATIQAAVNVAVAGDTINVLPGIGYCGGTAGATNGPCVQFETSGSAAAGPITLQGYPGAPMPVIASDEGYQAISIVNMPISYITIQGLDIAGHNSAIAGTTGLKNAWVNASAASYATASSALYIGVGIGTVVHAGACGICQNGPTTASANTTSGTSLSVTSATGIVVGDVVNDTTHTAAIAPGTTVTVVSGTTITLSQAVASEVFSGDGLQFIPTMSHIQILNNKIHDFPNEGISLELGDYLTVSGNLVYNNCWYGPQGGTGLHIYAALDTDTNTGTKITIANNVTWANIDYIPSLNLIWNGSSYGAYTSNTNATTPTSSNVLHFAASTNAQNGDAVFDVTHPTYIVPGTLVTATTSTTVTMSNNPTTTVASSDVMLFGFFTDGEGINIDDFNGEQQSTNVYQGHTLVENNLSFGNGSDGIADYASNNVSFLFNTTYENLLTTQYAGNANFGEIAAAPDTVALTGFVAANNIFYAGPNVNLLTISNVGLTSPTWTNNLVYGGSGAAPPGSNNQTTNPNFINPSSTPPTIYQPYAINGAPPLTQFFVGFQLQPGSPAIDSGSATYTRSTDILGNPGLAGPSYDMGAFESPCSSYGGNTVQAINTAINTLMADGQPAGSITPSVMRQIMTTLWCGRSPYAH